MVWNERGLFLSMFCLCTESFKSANACGMCNKHWIYWINNRWDVYEIIIDCDSPQTLPVAHSFATFICNVGNQCVYSVIYVITKNLIMIKQSR